jgi:hypothetical protein
MLAAHEACKRHGEPSSIRLAQEGLRIALLATGGSRHLVPRRLTSNAATPLYLFMPVSALCAAENLCLRLWRGPARDQQATNVWAERGLVKSYWRTRFAEQHANLLFLATSNFPQVVDAAFTSRCDLVVQVPLPDREACSREIGACRFPV